jgi:alpha-mannosidase
VRAGSAYPHEELDRIWKTVLLFQFHDILPGTSIAWVYRDVEAGYAEVTESLERIISDALRALAGRGDETLIFNAAPHAAACAPAMGAAQAAPVTAAGSVLDNGVLRVELDRSGLITALTDLRRDREIIPPNDGGNLLQLHPDFPHEWDAWEIDESYRATVTNLNDGDVEVDGNRVRIRRSFGSSSVTQVLSLAPGEPRLDIETTVDWHERERLLKLAFPLDFHVERYAAETQFGHVHRPAHTNTSWDVAKFETPAHRWLHVGEPDYGVTVVNDSTYGWDVTRHTRPGGGTYTTVRASLLRAPVFPDPHADQGTHVFRHALVVGATIGDAIREGYRLNLPPRRVTGAAAGVEPLIEIDRPEIIAESMKLADDRGGDVVVRLYESRGTRVRAVLTPCFPAASAIPADLLERPLGDPQTVPVHLEFRPFEIKTLRLTR